MTRLRPGGLAGAVWTVLSAAVIVAAMSLAARVPGLGGLGRGFDIDGGAPADGQRAFAPVSTVVLSDLLGASGARRALGPGEPAGALGPAGVNPPQQGGAPDAGDGGGTQAPGGDEPEPGPVRQLTARPEVRIGMAADRATVRPGETIEYAITVANVGRGDATEIRIRSHVPEHTRLVASEGGQCEGEHLSITPNPNVPGGHSICVDAPANQIVAPGEHGIVIQFSRLRPGRRETFRFSVAVDPRTPAGTEIRNHSHVNGARIRRLDSNEVVTRVR